MVNLCVGAGPVAIDSFEQILKAFSSWKLTILVVKEIKINVV
jgi:hypothetical protein